MSSADSTEEPEDKDAPKSGWEVRRRLLFYRLALWGAFFGILALGFLVTGEWSARGFMIGLGMAAIGLTLLWSYRMVAALLGPDGGGRAAGPATGWRRRELEREKFWLLKAIKELEFDFQMRKISLEDFNEIAGRYKVRAVRVIRELDAKDPDYGSLIEREVAARVAREPNWTYATKHAAETAAADLAKTVVPPEVVPPAPRAPAACPDCGTPNDADAVFCKKCGKSLREAS